MEKKIETMCTRHRRRGTKAQKTTQIYSRERQYNNFSFTIICEVGVSDGVSPVQENIISRRRTAWFLLRRRTIRLQILAHRHKLEENIISRRRTHHCDSWFIFNNGKDQTVFPRNDIFLSRWLQRNQSSWWFTVWAKKMIGF